MKEALPGCKGIWTVYHKNTRIHLSESSRMADEEDEYHAYLIISLEARTMVLFSLVDSSKCKISEKKKYFYFPVYAAL